MSSWSLTRGVNLRCRSGAAGGDENFRMIVGEVVRRGNVRVERLVRPDPRTSRHVEGVDS
mgnify:CR=1 FL=1